MGITLQVNSRDESEDVQFTTWEILGNVRSYMEEFSYDFNISPNGNIIVTADDLKQLFLITFIEAERTKEDWIHCALGEIVVLLAGYFNLTSSPVRTTLDREVEAIFVRTV